MARLRHKATLRPRVQILLGASCAALLLLLPGFGCFARLSTARQQSQEVGQGTAKQSPLLGRRGALTSAGAGILGFAAINVQAAENTEPKVTARCVLDVQIARSDSDAPRRIVIGLFGESSPALTKNFAQACSETGPARYERSDVRSISKDRMIYFANFAGGDSVMKQVTRNYQTTMQKVPLAGPETFTNEVNELRHDRIGRVSMTKGGGTYNFAISPVAQAPWLDERNVVVGQVLEGLDVVERINKVPAYQKGGWANSLSGDDRNRDYTFVLPQNGVSIIKAELQT